MAANVANQAQINMGNDFHQTAMAVDDVFRVEGEEGYVLPMGDFVAEFYARFEPPPRYEDLYGSGQLPQYSPSSDESSDQDNESQATSEDEQGYAEQSPANSQASGSRSGTGGDNHHHHHHHHHHHQHPSNDPRVVAFAPDRDNLTVNVEEAQQPRSTSDLPQGAALRRRPAIRQPRRSMQEHAGPSTRTTTGTDTDTSSSSSTMESSSSSSSSSCSSSSSSTRPPSRRLSTASVTLQRRPAIRRPAPVTPVTLRRQSAIRLSDEEASILRSRFAHSSRRGLAEVSDA